MTAITSKTIQPTAADEAYGRAMQLQIAGRLDLAEPIYQSILESQPTHAGANYCLGMLLVQRRQPKGGLPHLLAALEGQPEVADYWLGYLEALLLLGENAQAAEALSLARQHGLAGKAVDEFAYRLESQSPWGMAATSPDEIERQEAAVMALVNQASFHDALPLAREMTKRFPEHGAGWKISGAMLWATGSELEAIDAMRISVRLLPQDAEAHKNLGAALNKLQRFDEAEHSLHRALQIDPNFAPAHLNLGHNYQMQGRYADARSSLQSAIALLPDDAPASLDSPRSLLLFVLNHDPGVDAQTLFAEHCRVGAYLERLERGSPSQPARDRSPERCLQVGLVSADLRMHSVAYFIEPLLSAWQGNANLRITVYYTNSDEDDASRRLKGYVARWRAVFGLSNAELAQRIADDAIDILIDLSGHTSLHRLGTFARKPAPIQASWLGYPGTTGLRAVDYYLADKHFLPPGKFENYFSEKLVYLPVVWPFQPMPTAPPVNRLPALDSNRLTFGSFNRIAKINQTTVQLWSRLLRAVPGSRMLLAGVPLDDQHRRLIEWFAHEGILQERLSFFPFSTQKAHFDLHHRVDIGLESTPYSGCTTSNHALWMGVPTLTLVGTTPASRLSAANLGHLGLEEFIAVSPEDFVAKGLRWANDLPALASLRTGLRARWQGAAARNPAFFAAGMELALRRMWQRWCAGLPAESFEITAADVPKSAAAR